MPRRLIPLEKLYDQNDVAIDPKMKPADDTMEEKNIGTKENPRIIKLSKKLPAKEKEEYINVMKRYTNVFSWRYKDLKEYDTSIIQHRIPIKPGERPFKKKLRRINPLLLPVIEKESQKFV